MGEFRTRKKLYGIGSRVGTAPVKINSKVTFEYTTWANMLKRCYSEKFLKDNISYIGCSVCDEWLVYENFYNWINSVEYHQFGWQLDKDLLALGNKVYSPDACVFLPPHLNKILVKTWLYREGIPPGVFYDEDRSKYRSTVKEKREGRINISIKRFDTLTEAADNYKIEKEVSVRSFSEQFKGQIDPRAYTALINYTIEPVWRTEK